MVSGWQIRANVDTVVHLTRIYTRTGDDGSTALGDFSRVPKTDLRLAAFADVHEANAAVGQAVALITEADAELLPVLKRVQNDLFDVGGDLCVPQHPAPKTPQLRVAQQWITELEADCDAFGAGLPSLRSFVLPGGTPLAAALHFASTVVRRAERATWAALATFGDSPDGGVNPLTARYLNRLSDLLFILARYANRAVGDVLWQPGGGRAEKPN